MNMAQAKCVCVDNDGMLLVLPHMDVYSVRFGGNL